MEWLTLIFLFHWWQNMKWTWGVEHFPGNGPKVSWRKLESWDFSQMKSRCISTSDGSGSILVAQVGSGQVSHLWFHWFGFGFGKFPLKMSNFSIFFPSGQKKSLQVRSKSTRVKGRLPLIYCVKSKLGSGQVRAHISTIYKPYFISFSLAL